MTEKIDAPVFVAIVPFLAGAVAGVIATIFVQPFDTIKVRLQLCEEKLGRCRICVVARRIVANEGFFSLYKGLDAAIVRQVLFNTVRLGLYQTLQDAFNQKGDLKAWITALVGGFAGFMGSVAACPGDVVLVRIQADNTLPEEERRNYKNVFHAFYVIVKKEGLCILWTGVLASAIRVTVINLTLFVTFEIMKNFFKKIKENIWATILGSLCSSIISTILSLPFDNAKTALQFMKVDPETGKFPYNGMLDYVFKTLKEKGPFVFYRGYIPYWTRVAPHQIVSLILLDIFMGLTEKYFVTN